MADGKWITGLTPEMPADEAARVVLAVRLSAVRHHLPLAAERAVEDVEHVHQLRVATRRAGAAVWIFRDLLPKKSQRAAKRFLRAIRRAAGDARDWDVFLTRFAREKGTAVELISGYALRERTAAQDGLLTVARALSGEVHDGCAEIPAAVRLPANIGPPPTFSQHAATILGSLLTTFVAEIETGPSAAEELHQIRITAKRLRYSMEVFAGCCTVALKDELYPAVEEVQEVLGRVQDHGVAAASLEEIGHTLQYYPGGNGERLRSAIVTRATEAKEQAAAGEQEFQQWVSRWRMLTAAHPLEELLPASSPGG